MDAFDVAGYAALALALVALAAVVLEIAVKSPRSFLEMMTDTRRFAEPARPRSTVHALPAGAAPQDRQGAPAARPFGRSRAA
ncbi:MAG: hypothetical protein IRY94_10245 [Rhodospirillaceae bacterium]|nr:hypothetical protein [Rhodospirillaceae bacterium]